MHRAWHGCRERGQPRARRVRMQAAVGGRANLARSRFFSEWVHSCPLRGPVQIAAARRLAAVKQRSEGNPQTPAIWPAMSTPAMKAAEPAPRTQPYSNAPGGLRIVERDHESAKASDSGTSGASMAAQIKVTKGS